MPDGGELAHLHETELLGRPRLGLPPAEAARALGGRRILITGAGGSVGRPLAAAILQASPAELVLVDHHEASLWELHRDFGERQSVTLLLADVRNRARLADSLRRSRPELIFHLAAYKHVPFGEAFADEAFGVNVLGTRALLELAVEADVERFVYPSSDKACDPPSLYGATKRLSELLVRRTARRGSRAYNVARFVNILGTQGSVVETFARQAQTGGPLTVTDAAMTRYWIGMDEAVWLLLSAAGLPDGERTLMLDAGQEVSVVEMAGRVWRLVHGDQPPCAIVYGAPRPGERLREHLLSTSERFEPGPQPGLLEVVDDRADEHLERAGPLLDRLARLVADAETPTPTLRAAVMAAARELQ